MYVYMYVRTRAYTTFAGEKMQDWICSFKGWGKVEDWQPCYYNLPQVIQFSFLYAQVCNSYFECPWEHCKPGRGTEHQLSHEQQVNRALLNQQVSKHGWYSHTSGRLGAICSSLPPRPQQNRRNKDCFKLCFIFPIHQLKRRREKSFPLKNLQRTYKPAEKVLYRVAVHPTATLTNLQTPAGPQLCLPSLHPTNPAPREEPDKTGSPWSTSPTSTNPSSAGPAETEETRGAALGCLVQREIHGARRKTLLVGERFLFVIHNILLLAAKLEQRELERILTSSVCLFKPILAALLLSKQYRGEEFTGARFAWSSTARQALRSSSNKSQHPVWELSPSFSL